MLNINKSITIFFGVLFAFGFFLSSQSPSSVAAQTQNDLIYGDGFGANWRAAYDARSTVDAEQTAVVQNGTTAISVDVTQNWGTLPIRTQNGSLVSLGDYKSLRFWIYTSDDLHVFLRNSQTPQNSPTKRLEDFAPGGVLPANEWVQLEIPLTEFGDEFGYNGQLSQFDFIYFQGRGSTPQPTFFIDDLELVTEADIGATPTNEPEPEPTTETPTVTPEPPSNVVIYDDAFGASWRAAFDSRTTITQQQSAVVQSGSSAIGAEVTANWGTLPIRTSDGSFVSLDEYETISFWIYTSDELQIRLRDSAAGTTSAGERIMDYVPGGIVPSDVWTFVEIPLSEYAAQLTQFDFIYFQGRTANPQPSFFVDQIELKPVAPPETTPTPEPPSNLVIYDDAFSESWRAAFDSRTTITQQQTAVVQSGSSAIGAEVTANWGTLPIRTSDGSFVNLDDYESLSFWVYTSDELQLRLRDSQAGTTSSGERIMDYVPGGIVPEDVWTFVEIPLSEYEAQLTQFDFIYFQGRTANPQPTFFIDQMELKPSAQPEPTPEPTPAETSTPEPTPTLPSEPTATPEPFSGAIIYDDAFGAGWRAAFDSRTTITQQQSAVVQSGSSAIQAEVTGNWGTLPIRTSDGSLINLSDYKSLTFWIYTSDQLQLRLRDSQVGTTSFGRRIMDYTPDGILPADTWTFVEIPLDQFSNQLTQFDFIYFQGRGLSPLPTLYVDQIELTTDDVIEPTPEPTVEPTATPEPVNDEVIYDDAFGPRWRAAYDSRTTVTQQQSAVVQSGSSAIGVDVTGNWGTLPIRTSDGSLVSLDEFESLSFWIYTSDDLQVRLRDSQSGVTSTGERLIDYVAGGSVPTNEWVNFTIPLSEYAGQLTQFDFIYFQGRGTTPQPTFFVDQIELKGSSDPTGISWSQVVTSNQPDVTDGYAMAYDEGRDVVVLYGGGRTWPYSNETWEFDGTSWTQVATTAEPNAVYGMTLTYDPIQNELFLFGGSDVDDNELNELWRLDGGVWSNLTPAGSPPVRSNHAAGWDSINSQLLVYGGNERGVVLDDVWAFASGAWSQVNTTGALAGRTEHTISMNDSEMFVFGGRLTDGSLSNDAATLNLADNTWSAASIGDPGGRMKHTAVYWADQSQHVVMGGTASSSESYANLVWTYSSGTWGFLPDGPDVMRERPAVAVYDAAEGAIVVYTGTQTWVLK